MDRLSQIDIFSRYTRVSRETTSSLKLLEHLVIEHNKTLNLVGKSTIKDIWIRHFLDSAQAIDFVDKNNKSLIDLGSGAGFPGLVLSVLAKDRKISLKVKLLEKSRRKSLFLKEVVRKLNLNIEILNFDILKRNEKIKEDIIVARAFMPLKKILTFLDEKSEDWKKIFLFLGKTGKNDLVQASKTWDLKYKQRMSITSSDSLILEINKFQRI